MTITVIQGDALEVLRTLPDGAFQCSVTSPPYWQKRDYGHEGQIGLEDHPEDFLEKLVAVMREVRRVVAKGGTAWVNIGDSYASGGNGGGGRLSTRRKGWREIVGRRGWRKAPDGYKDRDLVLVPLELASALRDDGWHLRQIVIWARPRASEPPRMDRPAVSHEYLLMLSNGVPSLARDPGEDWWKASVWVIPEVNVSIDHPAPMPEELVRRCVVASTDRGGGGHRPFRRRWHDRPCGGSPRPQRHAHRAESSLRGDGARAHRWSALRLSAGGD